MHYKCILCTYTDANIPAYTGVRYIRISTQILLIMPTQKHEPACRGRHGPLIYRSTVVRDSGERFLSRTTQGGQRIGGKGGSVNCGHISIFITYCLRQLPARPKNPPKAPDGFRCLLSCEPISLRVSAFDRRVIPRRGRINITARNLVRRGNWYR